MIINQQPPSSGGGGGAGEWTDISSAISGDMKFPVAVCETDGTYVHVLGNVNGGNQEILLIGYPPKSDFTADMYKIVTSGSISTNGTIGVEGGEGGDGPHAYISPVSGNGFFSIVYPIAT